MSFDPNQTDSMMPDQRRGAVVAALRRVTTHETFDLEGARRRWVVGAARGCEIVIDGDPYVSQAHCVLERKPGGSLLVRDSGSRNGTHVDGAPVEIAELRIGAYLGVGRTSLVAIGASGPEPVRAIEMLRGRDPVLRTTVEQAQRAALAECSVLIVGETGTGKDLFARVIHEGSRRSAGPFVAVNCGAIPRELIGSELFGHEKGAFTGAVDVRDGFFTQADGGTLFLDEIGELPLELQPTLLRALESRRIRRIGGQIDKPIDVRIIAATNRLEGLGTEASHLRLDLYHRLATVVLALPALRDRMGDLGELVEAMLAEHAPEHGLKRITDEAWLALAAYAWPGNVRELRHAVTRAVTLGGDDLVARDFFPDLALPRSRPFSLAPPIELAEDMAPYQAILRGAMQQALRAHGTIRAAAKSIGMPKSTFADRARAWGLVARRRPRIPFTR
jgi:transcriptional regulator with PAS, ATPase and Fis domain